MILNVDADHLDYFGTLENIIASFRRFASKASKAIIANLDDAQHHEGRRRSAGADHHFRAHI